MAACRNAIFCTQLKGARAQPFLVQKLVEYQKKYHSESLKSPNNVTDRNDFEDGDNTIDTPRSFTTCIIVHQVPAALQYSEYLRRHHCGDVAVYHEEMAHLESILEARRTVGDRGMKTDQKMPATLDKGLWEDRLASTDIMVVTTRMLSHFVRAGSYSLLVTNAEHKCFVPNHFVDAHFR